MGMKEMPVAIVLGVCTICCLYGTSEITNWCRRIYVAGGFAGKPINVITGKTVDLTVPITEIIIEGFIDMRVEPEGPFMNHTACSA